MLVSCPDLFGTLRVRSNQPADDRLPEPDHTMHLSARNLRPAKVRSAVRRRWFEWQVPRLQLRQPPHGIVALGSSYGGWLVPDGVIAPSWTCYCVGAGGDVSFDLELISRCGATVRAFDPVESYVRSAAKQGAGEPRFSVHRAAIATADGPIRMQLTHDSGSSSVSAAGLYDSHAFIELPGRTLASLMAELGDERVDLLKLDIEGAEYELLAALDLRALGVQVFATQLHHTGTIRQAHALIARLHDQGYEPVACRSAVKITFAAVGLLPGGERAAPERDVASVRPADGDAPRRHVRPRSRAGRTQQGAGARSGR